MLGLQLYTVRSKMTDEESAVRVIASVKALGYECVQLAGDIDTVALTARAARRVGIAVIGILVTMDICEEEEARLFELARLCGAKDIGISSSMKTEEEAYDIIARANRFAKRVKENGFSFSYHNHSNEFIRGASGRTLMELLLEGLDTECVTLMPDTYWLQHGGVDVRAFLDKVGERVSILHLKDMKRTVNGQAFSEIGRGNINFEGILETARDNGISCFIVEQDTCDGDPLDSARISYEYLRKIM